jgi:hypothetical protein
LRNYLPGFFPTFRIIAVIPAVKTNPKPTQRGDKISKKHKISSFDKENILDKRPTTSESGGSLVDPVDGIFPSGSQEPRQDSDEACPLRSSELTWVWEPMKRTRRRRKDRWIDGSQWHDKLGDSIPNGNRTHSDRLRRLFIVSARSLLDC